MGLGGAIFSVFPILERSQSVFIDTEEMFSSLNKRLQDVKVRLESKGHVFTVLHEGQKPLIKIDNIAYQAIPHAIYGKIPIHGVRITKLILIKKLKTDGLTIPQIKEALSTDK